MSPPLVETLESPWFVSKCTTKSPSATDPQQVFLRHIQHEDNVRTTWRHLPNPPRSQATQGSQAWKAGSGSLYSFPKHWLHNDSIFTSNEVKQFFVTICKQAAGGQEKDDKADHRQNTVQEEGSFGLKTGMTRMGSPQQQPLQPYPHAT